MRGRSSLHRRSNSWATCQWLRARLLSLRHSCHRPFWQRQMWPWTMEAGTLAPLAHARELTRSSTTRATGRTCTLKGSVRGARWLQLLSLRMVMRHEAWLIHCLTASAPHPSQAPRPLPPRCRWHRPRFHSQVWQRHGHRRRSRFRRRSLRHRRWQLRHRRWRLRHRRWRLRHRRQRSARGPSGCGCITSSCSGGTTLPIDGA